VAQKPNAARKKATSGRKQPKTSKPRKASNTVRDEVVKLLSRASGASQREMLKAFNWQAHSVRGLIRVLASKHGFKIESSKAHGVRTYRIK
jgi:predicted transcriptional regulator